MEFNLEEEIKELKKMEEEEEKIVKWINYFITRFKKQEDTIADIKADLEEIKKQTDILGKSVLALVEKKK